MKGSRGRVEDRRDVAAQEMTDERRHRTDRRPRRGRSTTDRVVSSSLAVAACAGIVGLLGLRTAQDANSTQVAPDLASTGVPLSSAGLSQQQLDVYAAALEAERQQLVAYRDQLQIVAVQLAAARNGEVIPSAGHGPTQLVAQPRARTTRQPPAGQVPTAQQPTSHPSTVQQAPEPPLPSDPAPPAPKAAPQLQAAVVQPPIQTSGPSVSSGGSAPQSTTKGSKAS